VSTADQVGACLAFAVPFGGAYSLYRVGFAVQDWRRRRRMARVRRNLVEALAEVDVTTHPGVAAALIRAVDAFDRSDNATALEALRTILYIEGA
jgi:phage head maturation protease